MTDVGRAGVIHDIGYQRYQGPRLGRPHAVRALFGHGLRTAFGLGRSARAKIFPWLMVAIVFMTAAVATVARAVTGQVLLDYTDVVEQMITVTILFCAVVAPTLVSRELGSGVLSLYFSRPLHRSDYALARLGSLVTAVWLMLAGPLVVMFLGAVFTVSGWSAIWSELADLVGALGFALMQAIVFGALAIAIASLVARRAVASGLIVAGFLVPMSVVGLLESANSATVRQLAELASPATLVIGVESWVFGNIELDIGRFGWLYAVTAVVLVAVLLGIVLVRYRRIDA